MNRLAIKHHLLNAGMTLAELSRAASIPYDRMVKILGGYRKVRRDELASIAAVLEVPAGTLLSVTRGPDRAGGVRTGVEDGQAQED